MGAHISRFSGRDPAGVVCSADAHGGNPINMKNILVLVVAIAGALVIQSASAGAIHSFEITENSPTSLTITYDNSPLTVTFRGSDTWTFLLPAGFLANDVGGLLQWTEPE